MNVCSERVSAERMMTKVGDLWDLQGKPAMEERQFTVGSYARQLRAWFAIVNLSSVKEVAHS